MSMNSFEDSRVWQASTELAVDVYKIVKKLPEAEKYALSSQLRRAVVSISTNIAEGFGRTSSKEKIQFYSVAYGSLLEVKSLLLLAQKLNLIRQTDCEIALTKVEPIQKQINAAKTSIIKNVS